MIDLELHTLFVFKAATAKVDDFNGTLGWMLQEDVLHVVSDESHRRGISNAPLVSNRSGQSCGGASSTRT